MCIWQRPREFYTPFKCSTGPLLAQIYHLYRIPVYLIRRRRVHRLDVPNHIGVLLDASIAAEKPHPAHADDALADPLVVVLVRFVHQGVSLDVTVEIVADEVVISLVDDGITQRREPVGVAEPPGFDGIKHLGQIRVERERAVVVGVTQILHVFGQIAEKEDVRVPDFPGDFNLQHQSISAKADHRSPTYVRTVTGPDDQATVQDEFHVARAAGFRPRRRDMLAQVGRRGDDLRLTHVVILDKNDLEQIPDIFVLVDHFAHAADEMDNGFGHPIPRSSFAAKNRDPWHHLLALFRAHGFDFQVTVNHAQDVQLLAFVFVDPFHLDVEQRMGIDLDASGIHNVLRQSDFVGMFDIPPLFLEVLIIRVWLKFIEQRQVRQEFVAPNFRCDELGKPWVGLVQPSSRGDPVGHVGKLVRAVDFDKVLENGGLDQVRMQFGHPVHFLTSNDRQISHSHHLRLRFLDDRDRRQQVAPVGDFLLHHLEELHVDLVDDLEVPREQILHQGHRPLLQGLRKDGMIRVSKGVGHNAPRLGPFQTFDVDQNSLQFHDCQRRMRIVQLDGHHVRKLRPRLLGLLKPADDIKQRCRAPEILLLQTQLLSAIQVIIRVQDRRNRFGTLLLRHGAFVFAVVEFLKIELLVSGFTRPQPQVVRRLGLVSRNRDIIRHRDHDFPALPNDHRVTVIIPG